MSAADDEWFLEPDGVSCEELAARVITAGTVPRPPRPPYRPDVVYPLALDLRGEQATVSFAVLDLHPDIATGWWCLAMEFERTPEGGWRECGEHDNTTSPTPFRRPDYVEGEVSGWIHWHSNGGISRGRDGRWSHDYFGIAPVTTARLVITTDEGHERDLPITPWNGAYATTVMARSSTLTGLAADGRVLGTARLGGVTKWDEIASS